MAHSKTSKTLPSVNKKPNSNPAAGAKKSAVKKVKIEDDKIDIGIVASPENTALALAFEIVARNDDAISNSRISLQNSPMFRIAVTNYGIDKTAIEAFKLPIDSDDELPTFKIRHLCALMLLAGRLIERNAVKAQSEQRNDE